MIPNTVLHQNPYGHYARKAHVVLHQHLEIKDNNSYVHVPVYTRHCSLAKWHTHLAMWSMHGRQCNAFFCFFFSLTTQDIRNDPLLDPLSNPMQPLVLHPNPNASPPSTSLLTRYHIPPLPSFITIVIVPLASSENIPVTSLFLASLFCSSTLPSSHCPHQPTPSASSFVPLLICSFLFGSFFYPFIFFWLFS